MPSSPPPPPPFPPGTTGEAPAAEVPSGRGWERRRARQLRRDAALAAQQQRARNRARRRTSVVGPLLMVSAGVLLLALQAGRISWGSFFSLFARWWPLLAVGTGVVLLLEWMFDARQATGQLPGAESRPRRELGALGGLLLTALLLIGAASTLLGHHDLLGSDGRYAGLLSALGREGWLGQRWEDDLLLEAPLKAGSELMIQSRHGNITVTGSSDDGKIHITAHQRLWAWGNAELERRREQERPRLEPSGDGLLLQVNGRERDQTDLTIEVPRDTALRIGEAQGEIDVSALRGHVTLANHQGPVSLATVVGDLDAEMRDDNASVAAHNVTGAVRVTGRAGDLSFSDITGDVLLRGDFFGTTHLERVTGPVQFKSSFTDLACGGVPGELTVEGRNQLEADRLEGPVTLRTSDRDITMGHVSHGATVTNRKGSITLGVSGPLAPVSLSTSEGTVEVGLPDESGFDVDAETKDGDIESQLGFEPRHLGERLILQGKYRGGGPSVVLRTSDGDIKVKVGHGSAEANVGTKEDHDGADDGSTSARAEHSN